MDPTDLKARSPGLWAALANSTNLHTSATARILAEAACCRVTPHRHYAPTHTRHVSAHRPDPHAPIDQPRAHYPPTGGPRGRRPPHLRGRWSPAPVRPSLDPPFSAPHTRRGGDMSGFVYFLPSTTQPAAPSCECSSSMGWGVCASYSAARCEVMAVKKDAPHYHRDAPADDRRLLPPPISPAALPPLSPLLVVRGLPLALVAVIDRDAIIISANPPSPLVGPATRPIPALKLNSMISTLAAPPSQHWALPATRTPIITPRHGNPLALRGELRRSSPPRGDAPLPLRTPPALTAPLRSTRWFPTHPHRQGGRSRGIFATTESGLTGPVGPGPKRSLEDRDSRGCDAIRER